MSAPIIHKLPPMDHTFTVKVEGKETRQLYEGKFTYTRPSLGKRLEISKMQAKLQEDLFTLPTDINLFVEMVATLRFTLTETPEWWVKSNYGLNLFDVNVITSIWLETQKFEDEWDKKVYGESDKPEVTKSDEAIKNA